MVAIEHDVFRIDVGHRVEEILRCLGVAAGGQRCPFECQPLLEFCRKQMAGFQKYELTVKVAKGFFGFELQVKRRANAVALQCVFNLLEKIVAAKQEFDRFVEYVEFFAQGVFERPGQCDHTVLIDFHKAELSQFGMSFV